MQYHGTLITVKNMEKSKRFYKDVLGLNVVSDFGANVALDGGVFLQTLESWQVFIHRKNIIFSHNASELYFEESDMDTFLAHLGSLDISYVHPLLEHDWGQRVVRFYDPDGHMIEVGEDMVLVVKRFAASGMTDGQIAERMGVPLNYIYSCLQQ